MCTWWVSAASAHRRTAALLLLHAQPSLKLALKLGSDQRWTSCLPPSPRDCGVAGPSRAAQADAGTAHQAMTVEQAECNVSESKGLRESMQGDSPGGRDEARECCRRRARVAHGALSGAHCHLGQGTVVNGTLTAHATEPNCSAGLELQNTTENMCMSDCRQPATTPLQPLARLLLLLLPRRAAIAAAPPPPPAAQRWGLSRLGQGGPSAPGLQAEG